MTAHVLTPTPGLHTSLGFYERLGFTELSHAGAVFVTDGQVLIEIDPDRYARAGVRVMAEDPPAIAEALTHTAVVHHTERGYLMNDPSGVRVVLAGTQGTDANIAGAPVSRLGTFAGLSLESTDVPRSVAFWSALGYRVTAGEAGQGWITLGADGCPSISIMKPGVCPHLFFNPSLTYFNGKEGNPGVIEAVRRADVPIAEEITHFNTEGVVDNIVLRDPGGYGVFIFND
jgi:hypothetical protein